MSLMQHATESICAAAISVRHDLYGGEESMQAALANLLDFQEEPLLLLTRCASSKGCLAACMMALAAQTEWPQQIA